MVNIVTCILVSGVLHLKLKEILYTFSLNLQQNQRI
jgi:hypothetical protein